MDQKYFKAVKAGLIGALLLILLQSIVNIVFFWVISKPSDVDWIQNHPVNSTTYQTGLPSMPPELLMAGIAICGGGILIFVIYLFAGVLAARFTATRARGAIDLLLIGAIAGAISEGVSAPFRQLMTIIQSGGIPDDIISWLISFLIYDYIILIIIAMILSAIAALVAGAMIRAFGKTKTE